MSKAPLHLQLSDDLRRQIVEGRFATGEQLPTEKELMETYGLSSSTVRAAVLALVREGLLYRKAGKGTFVTPRRIERDLLAFSGFSEEMRAKGLTPGSRLLDARWIGAGGMMAAALAVEPGERAFEIERVRMVDGAVVAVEDVTFPARLGVRLESFDLENESMTTLLEDVLGVSLLRAHQVVAAVSADHRLSQVLEVPYGSPLLRILRTAYGEHDRICYVSVSHYRADRYEYSGWIERPSPSRRAELAQVVDRRGGPS